MFKPVVLPEVALRRTLRRFAKHLGLSDLMGSTTAQVFLQTDPTIDRWDQWLRGNCGTCGTSPEICPFFHPREDQCHGDLTPENLQTANITMIELGRVEICPLRSQPE